MDFLKLMQQARDMQGQLQQMQESLGQLTVTGTAGGGMVTVQADGKGTVKSVKLDPAVVNAADVEMLEDLLVVAITDAQAKAQAAAAEQMGKLAGGLNLPFPLKLPF